jgi:hypothetical protein
VHEHLVHDVVMLGVGPENAPNEAIYVLGKSAVHGSGRGGGITVPRQPQQLRVGSAPGHQEILARTVVQVV